MPTGSFKNALYALALPVLGKRLEWKTAEGEPLSRQVTRILRRHRVVGACVQRLRNGELAERYTAGYRSLEPCREPVSEQTIFRTASIAKLVTALLVFRLQTLGKLNVCEEMSDFLGYPVQNPYYPAAPITLGMLLSHTSSIVDSPLYEKALADGWKLKVLLCLSQSFKPAIPGTSFQYSNLAAGAIGSMLEARFGESLETLAQRELFEPLGIHATFDITTLRDEPVADSYRVLPQALAFSAQKRMQSAKPLAQPEPEHRYTLASGNLYVTAEALGRLALVARSGGDGFLSDECMKLMKSRVVRWPDSVTETWHGMGVLQASDSRLCAGTVYGHQGIAYGAVNGVFWNDKGDGYAMLCSGASERRLGHLTRLNRDLIRLMMNETEKA